MSGTLAADSTTERSDGTADSDAGEATERVHDLITNFRPRGVPDRMWRQIGADVRAAVLASAPPGRPEAQKRCAVAARLAVWAAGRRIPTAPGVLYTPAMVERFIVEGCKTLSEPSRASYRSRLRRIGMAVNPNGGWPGAPTRFSRRTVKAPYTPSEVALLCGLPNVQTTELRSSRLRVLLAAGLGAGLDSRDLRHLQTGHVELVDGLAVIEIAGARPRVVSVLDSCVPMLVEGLELLPAGRVFAAGVNSVNRFVSSVNGDPAVPHLDPARPRSTWLVTQLSRRVPLGVLLDAAGLSGANTLADLVAFVDRPDLEAGLRLLAADDDGTVY